MSRTRTTTTNRRRSLVLTLVILGLGSWLAWTLLTAQQEEAPMTTSAISQTDLELAADTKVFFGHQSVGMNVLDGIPAVYQGSGVESPTVVETNTPPDGPAYAHAYIGRNGDPDSKLADFEKALAAGFGQWADVAMFKFCYLDITANTDVDALFAQYRRTMAGLEDTYPDVTFLYVTTPLTTDPGIKDRIKGLLGRPSSHPADNAARERFNALLRQEYGETGRLFDLAALESTAPDGSRVAGEAAGAPYFALYGGYASDEGHLTPEAAAMVAAKLLETIAATGR